VNCIRNWLLSTELKGGQLCKIGAPPSGETAAGRCCRVKVCIHREKVFESMNNCMPVKEFLCVKLDSNQPYVLVSGNSRKYFFFEDRMSGRNKVQRDSLIVVRRQQVETILQA
jgi:hypothetical protein